MSIILIIAIIWGASALARATKEAARQKEIERQRREQAARSAELARMTAEWKQRQAEAKIETQRLIALEREAMRQREVERKQAEWNRKQEEINRKHDEQIAKLNNKLSLVEREIDHYKPMLEVVDYLIANDFKVYIVSGTDRLITRGLAEGVVNIPLAQMIGSDESLVATGQGDKAGLDYTFGKDDKVVTGGEFLIKNLKTNKVTAIEQEIGVQPVLSFGNSGGDSAMANFTINNNKYKSAAYMLCCDDTERENGNVGKADKMRKTCEENGYTAISMKNDWTTIYGDGVTYKGSEKSEETQTPQ